MTQPSWDDYVATDPNTAVGQVQDNVDVLASDVTANPDSSTDDQLAIVDAQSSSYDAATHQSSAEGNESMGEWQAGQAASWEQWGRAALQRAWTALPRAH